MVVESGPSLADQTVLIVGRLSGPKNRVILDYLRAVAPAAVQRFPKLRFQVVGGPVGEEHRRLEAQAPYLRFLGHQKDLRPFYQKADVVVGAGRVALEAMALKKPVIAVGERLYVGPLTPENAETAKITNFGDCWEQDDFNWAMAVRELLSLLTSAATRRSVAKTGHNLVTSDYSMDRIFPRTEAFYRRTLLDHNLSQLHELPVLMYHRVVQEALERSKYNVYITAKNLEKHLLFLKVRGFTTVTFEDLMSKRLPKNPVMLTFDDGYEDNYRNLFPLLKKYGMKAVIYILGDRKHRTNYWDVPQGEVEAPLMKEGQIREMARSGHVEFGSHALDHVRLTDLPPAAAWKQIAGSREALGKLLGKPVLSLAYPFGIHNEAIKAMTAKAGYDFGVSVGGRSPRFDEDLFEIRRVHMFPHSSVFDLWKKTTGFYHRYRKLTGKFNVT